MIRNKWLQAAGIAIALFIIYWFTSVSANPFNQYTLLADAFLHGRLHLIDPPLHLELAKYGNEAFVIDPPAPALFLMPFVAIWGTDINQVQIAAGLGSIAMGLFWVAARQMGWNLQLSAAITTLLALGTNFWWAATDGSLWTFAHISAVFFLMAAFVEATGNRRAWLVGLLVGLAGMSRLPAFLTFPFFAYLLLESPLRPWREVVTDRVNLLRLGLMAGGLGVMAASYLAYNYARFGTIMDEGYDYSGYADEPWFSQGRFDISYIPRHLDGIFFKQPAVQVDIFPYLRPQNVGLALFFTTPVFLYIFNTSFNRFTLAAIAATLLTMVPHVLHGTVGWNQFGYRYSMDYFPMLAVLTAAGMGYQMNVRKWTFITLCCAIALWGTLAFHKYGWGA